MENDKIFAVVQWVSWSESPHYGVNILSVWDNRKDAERETQKVLNEVPSECASFWFVFVREAKKH